MERRPLAVDAVIERVVAAGYPWELAGLVFYVFFLWTGRGRNAERFTRRSRVAVLLAAIALVACVPLGYGASAAGIVVMLTLALVALASCFADARR